MKADHPEKFSGFYAEQLGEFDLVSTDKMYDKLRKHFVGESCLELGPSTGYMTRRLVDDFKVVVAVEGSKTLFDKISAYPNLTKIHSLFEEFVPARTFGTVVLSHVLEHIQNPVELLSQVKTWMDRDGVIVIAVPNSESFHRLAAVKMGMLASTNQLNDRDKQLGHYRVYDESLLASHVEASGLRVRKTGGSFLKFLSNDQMGKLLNSQIIDAYFELGDMFPGNCAEIFIVASPS